MISKHGLKYKKKSGDKYMLDIREKCLDEFCFTSRDDRTLNAIKNYFIDHYDKYKFDYRAKENFLINLNNKLNIVIKHRHRNRNNGAIYFTVSIYDNAFTFYTYCLDDTYNKQYVRGESIKDFIEWQKKYAKGIYKC